MKKLIKYLIILSIFYSAISLKCGENEIEGCNKCGTGENSTKCSLCEDKYFLVLDGEKCIRCDDELLAMAGCGGNCQMIKSEKNVLCQENSCKEGYYEIYPGTCAICSFLFNGCSKCSYTNEIFNCLECQYEIYYISTSDNICKYCNLIGCKKCLNENACEECNEGYVLYPNGKCNYYDSRCKKIEYSEEKEGGICLECNDGYTLYPNGTCIDTSNCKISTFSEVENRPICSECKKGYALYPNGTCNDYDYYCKNKVYSEQDKKGICLECNEGYYLDNTNKCEDCQYYRNFYGCKKCHSENSILICDQAKEGYYVYSSGKNIYPCSNTISSCKKCSYHTEEDLNNNILKCDECSSSDVYLSSDERSCKTCRSKENGCLICSDNEEQTTCDKCSYGYGLLSDSTCSKCSDNFGEGCTSCSTSPFDFIFYCTSCSDSYTLGNDGKCKHCVNDANLIGCKSCEALGINGFKCLSCLDNYILIDGRCQIREDNDEFSTCKEMENIGNNEEIIYSCKECKNNLYIFAKKDNNAKICVEPSSSNDLQYCLRSRKEAVGENNYTCLQCESEVLLEYDNDKKKQICKSCIEGYYKYEFSSSFDCYKCNNGCKKCHSDENNNVICDECLSGYIKKGTICKSCDYYYCEECALDENQKVICSKLKEPYFLNKKSEIDVCVNYIDYCSECSYLSNELKCDKCMEDYFINKDGKCEHCYINKNIGLGCISCTDNEELKKNAPCQKCNGENYFLTKENTCIFCKSENYGGLFCEECGYIEVNNEEAIGCVKCFYGYAIDGKCHDLHVSYCKEYGAYLNKNNEKEYGCIKCWEDYYLDENNECKTNQIDDSFFQENDNSYIKIYPDSDDKIIEGCLSYGYAYNIYYCISCDSNYILNKGYCRKKIDNPFLTECLTYDYSSSYLKCNSCNNRDYYINSILVCKNKYYGKCDQYENIGTYSNPIYSCKACYYTTILYENGMKVCLDSKILDNRCIEGKINTNYYTDIYTCTKCNSLYILSYSNYYEKKICKYIYEDEKTNNISISMYDSDTGTQSTNGKCNDGYFTRNGKVCIKCDDSLNGMPGCGGKCSFKIDRENQLQCEVDNCKDGYFETLPGKCELCNEAISGCKSCDYIINDKKAIFKPERKRKLICNECNDVLFLSDGVCKTCYDMKEGCSRCHKENNLLKCDQTYDGYYIDEEGNVKRCENNCLECSMINEGGINKVKCNKVYTGYYLDEEGNINKCEDNCEKCSMINENGNNKVKCEGARYGYFINGEGIIKKCSDENEGIANCNYCSFDSKLICKYCASGYDVVDGKCKALEDIYNSKGCSSFGINYDDNTHYCQRCKDDYLYIDNLKSCVKKTEETLYCESAYLIEIGKKTFYNCTSCQGYNYKKVKNSDGYFKCYNSILFKSISNNCNLIANIGTINEPFYICEECQNSWYHSSYYAILVDEYENQKCIDNDFTLNCNKGKKNIYYKKNDYSGTYYLYYNYNCTECKEKYALEYDDYTDKNKCTPLECAVPLCKKCFDDDVYTCEECLPGYTFNKLGFCYIKPQVTPTITFKDIFRFALNGLARGNSIFMFSFALRGLTRNKITEKHSFIISTMFKSTNRLRNLEDDKTFKTSCEFSEEMENSESELKIVDYNCYFESNEDLREDYKMDSISEGNCEDQSNLKAFNLDGLVKNVDDITKDNSVFGRNELNKYILFTIDEKSKQIQGESIENFNFTISGITNKPMANNLLGQLTFLNTYDKKASCEIDAKDKNNAFMKCEIDAKEINFTNKQISIKEQEIEGQDNNIYFDGLNDVLFIGIEQGDTNNGGKKSKKNIVLIIVPVLASAVFISLLVSISLFCYQKKHTQNTTENIVDVNTYNNKNTSENNVNPQTTENLAHGKKKRKKKKKKSVIIK